MIKAVTITNHLGESIRLDLMEPEKSGFIIKKIEGLGPVNANVNFTELATSDGAIDNSARLGTRNIVMSLKFLENPTIEDTRLLSYKYFPIKHNIMFEIETDRRISKTTGRVEKNEPSIFDRDEGCQISLLCPDPYFYSSGEDGNNETVFYGIEPLFEFEFDNDSLDEDLIEFGSIENQTEGVIFYEGDAEVGITITIYAIGKATGLTIYNTGTREIMRINDEKLISLVGSGIQESDTIIINTERGQKSITLLRNGITTNILNCLERPIQWFRLAKGDNVFAYTAETGLENLQFKINNRKLYEGV